MSATKPTDAGFVCSKSKALSRLPSKNASQYEGLRDNDKTPIANEDIAIETMEAAWSAMTDDERAYVKSLKSKSWNR